MIELIKRLTGLGCESAAPEDEDVEDYTSIVNSSKYADSNSNTDQIERLLASINGNKQKTTSTWKDDAESQGCAANGLHNDIGGHGDQDDDDEKRDAKASAAKQRVSIESIICRESEEVLPGQPCYVPAKFGKEGGRNFNLGKFDIPRWIYDSIKSNDVERLRLAGSLGMNNYVPRFQTLLWVEEAQQSMEMRKYDMFDVLLAKHEDFFLLEVPGLAEGRPSLLRGDRLILRSEKRASCYEGYIHDVRERDILFKLHEYLHSTEMDGLRFVVQFIASRTPFRRCHHGVCQYREKPALKDVVFPMLKSEEQERLTRSLVDFDEATDEDNLPCFNASLNIYQKRAIVNILRARNRPVPYIIFGPPGTGKTVTMVEAILQVYARTKHFKILVCANSNASADLCARRIKDSGVVPLSEMIRVSAFYRMEKLVPPELKDLTKEMDMIDAYTYQSYRIVVTTCIQAGGLYEFKDRFDYVFIDEAGHACEPEALIPIGLLNPGGCCVLAGDPHQLGPVCISRVADQYGLGTSLLDRLCRRTVYARKFLNRNNKMDYNAAYITKLLVCYRCDPRVLEINNRMFYDGDLRFTNQTPSKWMELLKVDKPLVFHPISGRDRREHTNPSWFNPAEAIRCLAYVKRLYTGGLRAQQLGIISPYRRQIEKLQLLFDSCDLERCKIATIEEFQGDEREVIIITTVRTRERRLEFDQKFQLGFLFNPKRFNVAISRAKWLVVVVGDPQILERDVLWAQYMKQAFNIER